MMSEGRSERFLSLQVINKGPVTLQLQRIGFAKGRSGQFRTDNTPWPKLLDAGRQCAVVVRFTARHLGIDQQPLAVDLATGQRVMGAVRAIGVDSSSEQLGSNGIGRGRGLGRLYQGEATCGWWRFGEGTSGECWL